MSRTQFRLLRCQSAINRVQGMPFRWSLNPYRGCAHACQYCYARVTHAYFNLNLGRDFEEQIFVKTNLAAVLRDELNRPSWRHESIAIGTATDPYQPAEGTFRITRQCLQVLAEIANPCSVTTKGTLIVRDIDVMQQLARDTRFEVHLSLITLDRDLWRRLEPGAPSPASRLRALDRLRSAGVPVSVFLMPIVPGLTDRPERLAEVVRAAAEHGAQAVWSSSLRLAPGVKEWFFDFLRRDFPHLVPSYERGYAGSREAPALYRQKVADRVDAAKADVVLTPACATPTLTRIGRQYCLPVP